MSSKLVTVATFMTPVEADVARNALEAEGIACQVLDDTILGLLWQLGNALGGVKLQVDSRDAARARAVLAGGSVVGQSGAGAVDRCTCANCGEQLPPGFEICWRCSGAREGADEHSATECSIVETPPATETAGQDQDPELSEPLTGDALATRAWRAAVIGLFVCPPLLHFYSAWNLLRLSFGDHRVSREGTWKFFGALLIDIGMCAIVGWLLRMLR